MLLLEVVRQLVNVEVGQSWSRRRGTLSRSLSFRLGELLVLCIVTGNQETIGIGLHVAIVPSADAQIGSLSAIEVDEGKSLGVSCILIDYYLNGSIRLSKLKQCTYDCTQDEMVQFRVFLLALFNAALLLLA